MGGLSRKAFQFNKVAEEAQLPALIVDGGNLLFKESNITAAQEEQVRITAKGIVKSYDAMGYHAVGVAAQDMALGLDFLKTITANSNFPWLSANLYNKLTSAPVFTPSTTVEIGALQIGLIGLTGQADSFLKEQDDILVKPWQDVLPKIISDLSPKTDMLVLLSNLTNAENKEIAKLHEIHIIIQAGVSTANMTPVAADNTLICQTGKQGKEIGIMKISWQNSKLWGEKTAEKLTKARQNLDRLEWQLSKYSKYSNPLEELKNNPPKLRAYQNLIQQQESSTQEIAILTEKLSRQEDVRNLPATFTNQFIAMQTSLPNDPKVQAVVEEINEQINNVGKGKSAATNILTSTYSGWESCQRCHEEIFGSWSQTPHADAYSSLINKRQQFNLDCLPCHVTGITSETADLALTLPKYLRDVGCESCHGAAIQHVSAPDTYKPIKTPAAAVCLNCHTDEHDDSFDYQRDKQKVHPIP
nr:hypothetical protein [Desulfobulbaceae bacterium]